MRRERCHVVQLPRLPRTATQHPSLSTEVWKLDTNRLLSRMLSPILTRLRSNFTINPTCITDSST